MQLVAKNPMECGAMPLKDAQPKNNAVLTKVKKNAMAHASAKMNSVVYSQN